MKGLPTLLDNTAHHEKQIFSQAEAYFMSHKNIPII